MEFCWGLDINPAHTIEYSSLWRKLVLPSIFPVKFGALATITSLKARINTAASVQSPFSFRVVLEVLICELILFYLLYLRSTLRSGLHEIPTTIRTFPHGLVNNHLCKWISDNFPGVVTNQLRDLFCQNQECIENFSWQFFDPRVEKRKNKKAKTKRECIEKKIQLKGTFESWKVKILCSKSRVKLEI